MYKNILVPIVFDDEKDHSKGLKFATLLGGPDAKITLLHVVERLPTYVSSYIPEGTTERLHGELQEQMHRLVQDIPGAHGKIITGHSGRTIVEYADSHGVDLIIIESHRPGVQDYFLGSTAGHIVRRAKCSVHVIR